MRDKKTACLIVLGDIGHSPRMQNHAISLLEQGYKVDIICYMETKPLDALSEVGPGRCCIRKLSPVPEIRILPSFLQLIFKTGWQIITLLFAWMFMHSPATILIQNPPGIPTIMVAYLISLLTRAKLIIDWHNYSYTILALKMTGGIRNPLCRLIHYLEQFFGSKADAHFCVSEAMRRDLEKNWGLKNVQVLYDRPPDRFQPITSTVKYEILSKLLTEYEEYMIPERPANKFHIKNDSTVRVVKSIAEGGVQTQEVAIIISATSWTPDEDFNMLLEAFDEYEKKAQETLGPFPFLLCFITGRGPQKEEYRDQIKRRQWRNIGIITPWLSSADYPKALAAADLGICLHFSSSGLDLPMKIVDMFGCGVPVCARAYECLDELVHDGKNGFVFQDSSELSKLLQYYFEGYPEKGGYVQHQLQFEKNLKDFQTKRWSECWLEQAFPAFIVNVQSSGR